MIGESRISWSHSFVQHSISILSQNTHSLFSFFFLFWGHRTCISCVPMRKHIRRGAKRMRLFAASLWSGLRSNQSEGGAGALAVRRLESSGKEKIHKFFSLA